MKTCAVVGGGICGITASILLRRYYDRVVLIEQSSSLGGLLNSVTDEAGHFYDQGTHIPASTGINEIDEILFNHPHFETNWHPLNPLKTGNYFAGKWDLETQTIDARKLDSTLYTQGIGEFMSLTESSEADNIEQYLCETLGVVFYQYLSKPIIKKLYGNDVSFSDLAKTTSINYFGAMRIKAFNASLSRVLKQHPEFDKKLGFHSAAEFESLLTESGVNLPSYYYPNDPKGAQIWIDELQTKAESLGVEILCNRQIVEIESQSDTITAFSLNDGTHVECDLLFWSAPPVFALKAAHLPIANYKPTFRTANILHFTFDKQPLNTESHYLWNWDSCSDIFRVTLYNNLRVSDQYQLSAEVLRYKSQPTYTLDQGIDDLKAMGLIDSDTKMVSGFVQKIDNTFPVPTHDFCNATQMNYETLTTSFKNIIVSGRFSGRCWLLSDVLVLAHKELEEYCAVG
ncbi:NAD(P)-binding protein [Marinomonas sp. 15G1-11]|uniref:NAD(P)-binding protein n=1 Tax=Marinomonas phaeophyticola TaxID=3004091 RepID=A0ABT4JT34_9GAMM|nr:NAD(P)-binding protein [Marinomonas sp. 15G1-11]MCZ2721217.1 NAD(P)-binding protein [Marinomonas sp. 15G1-11]